MRIIVDSGSTKTDWRIINSLHSNIKSIQTKGINPVLYSREYILKEIQKINNIINPELVERLDFYGSGCSSAFTVSELESILKLIFVNAHVFVYSDLLAAVLATLGKKKGLAIILGTGANIAFADKGRILKTKSGNGYILGDEGSGAYIGKCLIKDYLNGYVPKDVIELLNERNVDKDYIIDRVYRREKPNLFLAEFSILIKDNIHLSYFQNLVRDCFLTMIDTHLLDVDTKDSIHIGIVGSIGFYFKDILELAFLDRGFTKMNVLKSPIDALVDYHISNFQ